MCSAASGWHNIRLLASSRVKKWTSQVFFSVVVAWELTFLCRTHEGLGSISKDVWADNGIYMTVRIQSFPAEYWSVLLMITVSGFQSSSVPTWNISALIYSLNRQAAELNFSSKVPGFTCRVNMSSSEKTSAPQHKKEPVKVPRASDQDGPCLLPSGISGMSNWDETPEQTLNPLEVLYITCHRIPLEEQEEVAIWRMELRRLWLACYNSKDSSQEIEGWIY